LFPTYAHPSLSGSSLHVDSPTSSKKVIDSSVMLDIDSNPTLSPCPPTEKLKNLYDHTWKFQFEWATKLPWVEGVLANDGKLHMVKCKVCSTIDKKPYLLTHKWDTLMKHEGRRKACIEGFSKYEDHERRLVQ
jgi:hypothetical protein